MNPRPIAHWLATAALAAAVHSRSRWHRRPRPSPSRPQCQVVRLSDVGWTDVTSTTALFAELLRSSVIARPITVLSVPVTFASMKNRDIDVFLGNWMPAQDSDRQPYRRRRLGRGRARQSRWARSTRWRCRPTRYAAGLHDFSDIQRFGAELNNTIYGIEPGNDGNRHVLKMIQQNDFGLGNFKLIESSEQGMLAQVERAFDARPADRVPRAGIRTR